MDGEKKTPDVPYIVHEAENARMERVNSRLLAVLAAVIVLLFAFNLAWLWAWTRYDYVSDTYTATQDGNFNIMGGGSVSYGAESDGEETP